MKIETTAEMANKIYSTMESRLSVVRKRLGRALTLSEKILYGHLDDAENQELSPGQGMLKIRPDRVAMQDATAQMALLQFAQAQIPQVAVPSTVHCDHLIRAYVGSQKDIDAAVKENKEVYDFLRSTASKYGIGFWKPGSGIIHQVVLENYAFPGGLMIGTDSHTPNAGGLGMIAVGVGGANAVDVMAGFAWEVKHPTILGVRLTGELKGWTAPKDVILKLCGILTVKGGTNRIVEYFGPGTESISCTGKGTITNMGAELGATTSIFPFDERMAKYLEATRRGDIAEAARKNAALLKADPEVEATPEKYFEKVIEINLSELEPYLVGPHTPDLARPISELAKEVKEKNYPDKISSTLIGSCTNSSYEDINRAVDVALQAKSANVKMKSPLMVSPGSDQIYATIQRDGQAKIFEELGATVLANACGPCIGQWKRDDVKKGESNSIVTSFNRNFPARNDGNAMTLAFIGSPEIVVALGLAGRLSFNPMTDELETADGKKVKLAPPKKADELPQNGFVFPLEGYAAPAEDGSKVEIEVDPASDRLQLLDPFPPWDGSDFIEFPILLKAQGKCTTDHISPAGPWLKYRGHLDKISDNMFLGATNAYSGETGKTINILTGEKSKPVNEVARAYKAQGLSWVAVGDENYGEGSSREHAAMCPRFLGAAAVIARSFARIHETNLKKQGVLAFTFANPADYDRVQESDCINITGLAKLRAGSTLSAELLHSDGTSDEIQLKHSLTEEQIEWFRAGSALNLLKQKSPA